MKPSKWHKHLTRCFTRTLNFCANGDIRMLKADDLCPAPYVGARFGRLRQAVPLHLKVSDEQVKLAGKIRQGLRLLVTRVSLADHDDVVFSSDKIKTRMLRGKTGNSTIHFFTVNIRNNTHTLSQSQKRLSESARYKKIPFLSPCTMRCEFHKK